MGDSYETGRRSTEADTAFFQAKKVEQQAQQIVYPFLREYVCYENILLPLEGEGALVRTLQEEVGDLLLLSKKSGELISVELKAEEEDKHGNLFLETWSNKSHQAEMYNPGWLFKSKAMWLVYCFHSPLSLYVISLAGLRRWAFSQRGANAERLYDFPEKPMSKYPQKNRTFGRTVPIHVLQEEANLRTCNLKAWTEEHQYRRDEEGYYWIGG